jgi:hypothetical protein
VSVFVGTEENPRGLCAECHEHHLEVDAHEWVRKHPDFELVNGFIKRKVVL